MNKAYLVIESSSEYYKSFEKIIGVCTTPEIADALKESVEQKNNELSTSITEEEWGMLYETLMDNDDVIDFSDVPEGIAKLFPEYSIEDIKNASLIYEYDRNIYIEEVDVYNDITQIIK